MACKQDWSELSAWSKLDFISHPLCSSGLQRSTSVTDRHWSTVPLGLSEIKDCSNTLIFTELREVDDEMLRLFPSGNTPRDDHNAARYTYTLGPRLHSIDQLARVSPLNIDLQCSPGMQDVFSRRPVRARILMEARSTTRNSMLKLCTSASCWQERSVHVVNMSNTDRIRFRGVHSSHSFQPWQFLLQRLHESALVSLQYWSKSTWTILYLAVLQKNTNEFDRVSVSTELAETGLKQQIEPSWAGSNLILRSEPSTRISQVSRVARAKRALHLSISTILFANKYYSKI